MPLYEYQCEECGLNFEVRQKFTDDPVKVCGRCGGLVKKQISQTAFALKGGGWYDQGYSQGKSCQSGVTNGGSDSCAACPKAVNS
ncbi:FmdB family zinc ribbon protein [uncultured Desulfuromusa sp.]|uniref:FmdB family zinc ribbon protein n=1 Tax=uncultured Desulfuromusa sp. TaxID=219183 RepID=UPI002AA762E2|nr:FmdB family zinc ribbon protein [uncultured Desulfuromusa sp.]